MAVTKYLYDGDTVLQETDGAGVTQDTYTSTAEQYGDLLSAFDGAATAYHEPDALGSTDALTNDAQTVTDRWSYRAFGAATHVTGSSPTPFTWVGRQGYVSGSETGLYLLGSGTRYYATDVNQFLSEDPIGFAGGDANTRRYVRNNPANRADPTGLASSTEKECQDAKSRVLDSLWFGDLQRSLRGPWMRGCQLPDFGGFYRGCPLPTIKCVTGRDPDIPSTRGIIDPEKNEIRIFFEIVASIELERLIAHELVHAFDICNRFPRTDKNFAISACAELRAYYFAGQCNTPKGNGGLLEKGERPGDCLFRVVADHVRARLPVSAEYSAEEYVCCVWDTCVADKRMPGSGFYGFAKPPGVPKKPERCTEKFEASCAQVKGPGFAIVEEWFK